MSSPLQHYNGLSLIEPLKWSFMKCWAYTFMCIYQLITFYSWINSWHDTLYIVKTAVVYGIAFQVTIRLYIYVTRANSLNGLKLYTDELYKAIENSDLKRMMLMVNTIRKAKTAFKVLLSFYVFSSALFLVNPIYELVINKRRTTIFPYKMPYINTNSYYGYLFTLIVELLLDGYLAFGLAGFDGTFIFYAMQTIGLVGLIKVDMDEFRDLLVMKCLTEKEIRKRLRRIINIHKELNAFIDMLKRFFIIQTFAIVTSSVISVCMCLISIVFSKWYAAFGFIIAALFQLFITCMLGTMIEIQNDLLLRHIWNFPWYLMKVPEQKQYMLLLMKAQNPNNFVFDIGGPLNMETFTKIINTIYSVFMIFLSMWE